MCLGEIDKKELMKDSEVRASGGVQEPPDTGGRQKLIDPGGENELIEPGGGQEVQLEPSSK